MHRTMRLLALAGICIASCLTNRTAQAEDATALFRVSFRDSVTDGAVVPALLRVDGQDLTTQVDATGSAALRLPPGQHQMEVQAAGYLAMHTRQTVVADEPVLNTIALDPVRQPTIAAATALQLADAKLGLLTGYVIDDRNGQPLSNALVSIAENAIQSTTDDHGFFSIAVPLADGTVSPGIGKSPATYFAKKTLTVAKDGFAPYERRETLVVSGDTRVLRIRLQPGTAPQLVDDREGRGNLLANLVDGKPAVDLRDATEATVVPASKANGVIALANQAAPATIRVGRTNCSTNCTTVITVSMETYVKHVLPAEWYASWRAESLKAGAVAIRSYGAYHVYHPKTATYDICDSSACQVYRDTTATSSDAAVDATAGTYMIDTSGNIARSEYSAENNNSGTCGDCNIINNPATACLSDSVCCGTTLNGHGRGMCQWGTQRWALNQGKTYDWICDHYYDNFNWTRQNLLVSISQQPQNQSACPGGNASFTVVATGPGTLTYQWQKNGVDLTNTGHYSGTTTATLNISNVDTDDLAAYHCIITISATPTVSDDATLTLKSPTVINAHPAPVNGCPGGTFAFTVSADGDGISYQWQKDTANLSEGGHCQGVTTHTLTVSSADAADIGQYRCVVAGDCGSLISDAAALTLDGPAFAPADFDHDHDVDQEDFAHIQYCLSGLGVPQADPDCFNARLAGNTSIAESDVTLFLHCMSGPNNLADTCCTVSPP